MFFLDFLFLSNSFFFLLKSSTSFNISLLSRSFLFFAPYLGSRFILCRLLRFKCNKNWDERKEKFSYDRMLLFFLLSLILLYNLFMFLRFLLLKSFKMFYSPRLGNKNQLEKIFFIEMICIFIKISVFQKTFWFLIVEEEVRVVEKLIWTTRRENVYAKKLTNFSRNYHLFSLLFWRS